MLKKKAVILMSGGVDSSVAAVLMKDRGFDLIGLTMKIWDDSRKLAKGLPVHNACIGPGQADDVRDAQRVCETLDIPFHAIDLSKEYNELVLDYFKKEYLAGRTPNPCTRCNPMIKMGLLIERARETGIKFDYFATGHYARVAFDPASGCYAIERAKDLRRDQSYFLYRLDQDQLAHVIFPLGEYAKDQVREIARAQGLVNYNKKDSQDFYGGNYSELLGVKDNPGPILDKAGRILGQHKGIWRFTIGQRKGVSISGPQRSYVIGIDKDRNAIIVGYKEDLLNKELIATDLTWMGINKLAETMKVKVKIRYRHVPAPAIISPMENDGVKVVFDEPQTAVTPGQSVVFYSGNRVLGGGIIQ